MCIYFLLILVDYMQHNFMAIILDEHFLIWYVFVFLRMIFFKSNETDMVTESRRVLPFSSIHWV